MFVNTMPRYEVLSAAGLDTIERGWRRLVSEIGIQFDHPRALELFAAAGQTVEETLVKFDPDWLREQVALAPPEFDLRARNSAHDLHIGGDHMIFAPSQGPPFVRIRDERGDGKLPRPQQVIPPT